MFNPFGLGGALELGGSANYNIDAGRLVPQATARYATELGGGVLGFAGSATPDDGWGAFIDWSTSF